MFNVGGGEILVILLLALLVLGPDKLPEYARKAGRYMNEFRRLTSGFQEEFRQAMDLSDSDSSPSSTSAAPAATGDALDRATEGPRLVAQPDPPAAPVTEPTAAPVAPATPVPEAPAVTPAPVAAPTPPAPSVPPAPAYGGAFAADVTPAPAPEVDGPAGSDHDGGTGSTSAA